MEEKNTEERMPPGMCFLLTDAHKVLNIATFVAPVDGESQGLSHW
jgi:hypothetical protein